MENKYPKNWHDIDWKETRKEVSNLQEKIVIVMQNKKYIKKYLNDNEWYLIVIMDEW